MKKTLTALASLAIMIGLVSSAQAGTTAATTARSTKAPPAVQASKRAFDLSKLEGSKRLSREQLKALGLKPLSRQQVARIKRLQKSGAARAATAGTYYWYTNHYYGNSWQDVYYSGPYYSYPWYPYYVVYDNFKTCTNSGTGCYDANAFTYQYYLYYYPYSTWYYYGPSGYSSYHQALGFGPYPG